MAIRVDDIRLVHRVVGTKHVFTSPDVPELHVSHADEKVARDAVQGALDALDDARPRAQRRKEFLDFRAKARAAEIRELKKEMGLPENELSAVKSVA